MWGRALGEDSRPVRSTESALHHFPHPPQILAPNPKALARVGPLPPSNPCRPEASLQHRSRSLPNFEKLEDHVILSLQLSPVAHLHLDFDLVFSPRFSLRNGLVSQWFTLCPAPSLQKTRADRQSPFLSSYLLDLLDHRYFYLSLPATPGPALSEFLRSAGTAAILLLTYPVSPVSLLWDVSLPGQCVVQFFR